MFQLVAIYGLYVVLISNQCNGVKSLILNDMKYDRMLMGYICQTIMVTVTLSPRIKVTVTRTFGTAKNPG